VYNQTVRLSPYFVFSFISLMSLKMLEDKLLYSAIRQPFHNLISDPAAAARPDSGLQQICFCCYALRDYFAAAAATAVICRQRERQTDASTAT
jgi:hypothetical protein